MGRWLHKGTLRVLDSVSPNKLPEPGANYISEPDLSAVEGFHRKYWDVTGDVVTLKNAGQRNAVDVQETSNRHDRVADQVDQPGTAMRALTEVLLDEINVLRAEASLPAKTLPQLRDAVRGKL